ncbi:MAG: YgaP family membrane protein [Flavobacteriaceae bacterium]
MKKKLLTISILSILAFGVFVLPSTVSAHQPRITESRLTQVPDPEISKAYYGKLTGEPDVYVINASDAFDLYVNVLVPDIAGQKKDVSAVVLKNGKELAVLEGINFEWQKFHEPFGADSYWMGPEYKARAEAGTYEIRVWSSNNDSKYSLAIGEIEAFDGKEGINALTIIPELKKNFFEVSPISFIKSPFGWGLIVVMYTLAFFVGFVYRAILKRFAKGTTRGVHKNIGKKDRLLRLVMGVGLLLWAITTSWNPWLLFFSGFAFFEAIFSWCGFYAAIGKNTCPS